MGYETTLSAHFFPDKALARQIGDADEVRIRTQTLADFYAQTARLNDSVFNVP
jgi:ubiquinone biosynthesis protein UbiJ